MVEESLTTATFFNICLTITICVAILGFACAALTSNEGDMNLNNNHSSHGGEGENEALTDNAYSQSDSASLKRLDEEKQISGIGYGELLLTFTINNVLPVFSGRYSFDVTGIRMPPISTPLKLDYADSINTGYGYNYPNVSIPGKPNDFIVSVSGAKTLSVGLRKRQGLYEDPDTLFDGSNTRSWISTQAEADEKGTATIKSDLVSPGIYQAKIFGNAAENASQVNLAVTVVKKLVVKGPFNLSLNTTGFPDGDYKISIKALNGAFRIDKMLIGT